MLAAQIIKTKKEEIMKWLRVGEEDEKKDVHVFANFRLRTYSGKVSLIVLRYNLS